MPVCKPNTSMPTSTKQDQEKILQVIRELPLADQRECERLLREVGPLLLCRALHGMRRWYTGQTKAAEHVLRCRKALSRAMNLSPPIGVYRGFKYPRHGVAGDRVRIPDTLRLPHLRPWSRLLLGLLRRRRLARREPGVSRQVPEKREG
jgi:hypothetical protein